MTDGLSALQPVMQGSVQEMLSHLEKLFLTVMLSHLYLDYFLIGTSANDNKYLCKVVGMQEFEITSPPEFAEPNHQLTVQYARICLTNFCFKKFSGSTQVCVGKRTDVWYHNSCQKKYPASMYTKEGQLACCR